MIVPLLYAAETASRNGGIGLSVDWSSVVEVLKILIPAVGAWLAAHLSNRKDRRKFEESQQDKLTTGWSEMTAQSREIIARLQSEIVDIRTRAEVSELEARRAQQERDDLKEEMEELHRVFDQLKKDYSDTIKQLEIYQKASTQSS